LSAFADRIRGIVAPRVGADPGVGTAADGHLGPAAGGHLGPPLQLESHVDLAAVLGGAWRDGCFVVDRRWEPAAQHGSVRIGELASQLDQSSAEAPMFTGGNGGAPARPPFVFFDLETTGLSGGAGTLAFLVGCGWFEADGAFVTRQFLLARHADERPLLDTVAGELSRAGALVSFNGKSFDAPLLESRFQYHRLPWISGATPHIDVLHPARRFWRAHDRRAGSLAPQSEGCSLQALERQLLGVRRVGDVPGFEIPARYFQFVRSGDARPLAAVLEHNRLDLLTLAALTARLLQTTRSGPGAVTDPREALALGHVYARADRHAQGVLGASAGGAFEDRAMAAYRRALERCRSPRGAYDPVRIDALRALALTCRRARRHDEAASCWSELIATRGCPAPIAREATEALAIHHEHRRRDLAAAKAFALLSLESGVGGAWTESVRHRLSRIEKKMEGERPALPSLL
jgi:uncharacterized protein YprB with RNaseH-like and TPR domain